MKLWSIILAALLVTGCTTDVTPTDAKPVEISEPAKIDGNVGLSEGTTDFRHFAFELNADGSLKSRNTNSIVTTTFDTYVLENSLLKVTLVPEYGGRVLSIVHKPTNTELLYQNPVGTLYGIGEENFYYNYLMVYGGIFPTFPEPEHGKTWNQPWTAEIVEDSADRVAVKMSYSDTGSAPVGKPYKFNNGTTGLICSMTVSLERGSSRLDLDFTLENPSGSAKTYEYWTCQTLAPGSKPGNTFSPADTRIAVPVDKVILKNDWWPWMGSAESPTGQPNEFYYNNLADYANWDGMGIAYASGTGVTKEWYGVINRVNDSGIVRIGDTAVTPGLKFWTWGVGSLDNNPNNPADEYRSYIELWAGHGLQFFQDQTIGASVTKTWRESYFPSFGLDDYTKANDKAAVQLIRAGSAVTAAVSAVEPGKLLTGEFFQDGTVLNSAEQTASAVRATKWTYTGSQTGIGFRLKDAAGTIMISLTE